MQATSRRSLLAPPKAPAPPKAAEDSYRRRLRSAVGGAIERAYHPLLAALPTLSAAMAAQSGGARQDASPVDDAARLVKNGQSAFIMVPKEARAAAGAAALNISSHTKTKVRRQLDEAPDRRISAIQLTDSPRLKPLIEGFAAENVALIKGISPRLAADVQGLVVQGLTNGVPAARLAEQIRARMDISAQRAELIAIDQIGKLDGKLTEQRHRDLGVTHFFWHTSEDERVRGNPAGLYPKALPSHWDRNGKRYAYDDLPRGRNGEREVPGTPYRCRCWQEPDLSTIAGASAESSQLGDQPAAAQDVEALEAEASRMMAEVEAMLQRQQEEIEDAQRKQEAESARRESERFPDPVEEAQAQNLELQMQSSSPTVVETAVARHRRWKRRGSTVRGDQSSSKWRRKGQVRADFDPDQPRAPDGRFGEVAGKETAAPADTPALSREERASQRKQARAARVEAIRLESKRQGRWTPPSDRGGWISEAERDMEDARSDLESATDDLKEASDEEDRASARQRITASRVLLENAEGRFLGFSDLEGADAQVEAYDDTGDDGGEVREEKAKKVYSPLSADVESRYSAEVDSVENEMNRGFASEPHARVSIPDIWKGRTVGDGSLAKAVSVEELSHAFAPPEGFTAVVDKVTDREFSMDILNADGKKVGDIVREFRDGGEIHHSFFVLDKEAQGGGFADVVNGQALLRYEKLGVKKVTVDAAWIGRYKWATMGFRFDEKDSDVAHDRAEIEKRIEGFMVENDVSPATRSEVRSLIDEPWNLAKFSDGKEYAIRYQSGPKSTDLEDGSFHLGKALLLQGNMPNWTGVIDIDRNNEGYLHALKKLKVATRK
jgi:SPP1 gp7 family putative phage head morphogenesis protein